MARLLETLWRERRVPDAPGPQPRDWALVGLVVLISLVDGISAQGIIWRPMTTLLSAALALTLPWRRIYPVRMSALALGTIVIVQIAAYSRGLDWNGLDSNVVFFLLFPYALFRWGSGRDAVIAVGLALVPFMTTISVDMHSWTEYLGAVLFFLCPAALGASVRYRDSAQRRTNEQLRMQERERLARELHDTVAHHVSAIAIQAQAGQALAATQPEAALKILGVIEKAASRTLTEMRHIVHTLRDDAEAIQPPSRTLSDLKRLGDDEAYPLDVEISLTGQLDDLDAVLESTSFRLTQEAITNAVRHAIDAHKVDVAITGEPDQVRLRITDDGSYVVPQPPTGFGLRGMAERVAILGGTLHAGPGNSKGWVVEATLPRRRTQ
ncbi:MAG: sensor histidine kinase [Burkholderiaceae bacterium]